MAMDIRTPRFYCDLISYQLSRGKGQNGNFDVISGSNLIHTFTQGSEPELFDMRPSNLCSWDTTVDNGADHVVINIDTGHTTLLHGFIAILNHNMKTADAKFRVYSEDDPNESNLQAADFSGAHTQALTEVVNGVPDADSDGTYIATPRHDGSTIVTFAENNDRYWGIQFVGATSNTFSGTALTVGCVLMGEYFDMPVSPDMSIKRSIVYDKVKVQESIGGQRYSNMTSHGRQVSGTSKSPFSTTTSNQQVFGGRITYDMAFSYLNSTDLMPDEYDTYNPTDDSFVEDVWNRTNGGSLPMILSIDGSLSGDGNDGEHLFARFSKNSLDMTQVANDIWSMNLSIEEEF